LDPAFLTGAALAPFLVTPFPAASSAFLFNEVLEVETPLDVKKLERGKIDDRENKVRK
jgi:hypothetical protein